MQATLQDLQTKYKNHLQDTGKAPATVIAYSKDIEQLVGFLAGKGKSLPQDVRFEDIDEFKELLKKQRYTSKSISRKINSTKSFFDKIPFGLFVAIPYNMLAT